MNATTITHTSFAASFEAPSALISIDLDGTQAAFVEVEQSLDGLRDLAALLELPEVRQRLGLAALNYAFASAAD